MSPPLPPEILDLVVDQLCDEPTTLKNCCLVSMSWVPRARRHLFAEIRFGLAACSIKSWMAAFPDPSSSPAHYTRRLGILDSHAATFASTDALTWIRHFHNVVELKLQLVSPKRIPTPLPLPFPLNSRLDSNLTSLAQLRALSPTLKYLYLYPSFLPLHEFLDFICSFPLLEDLYLRFVTATDGTDGQSTDLTSPKFTGALSLIGMGDSVARGLLALPGGLHFTKIKISCTVESAGLANDVVSKCSNTLESLAVAYFPEEFMPPPPFDISKATKLKEVEFILVRLDTQWIVMTLQTAKIENLQRVAIEVSRYGSFADRVGEATRREWQNLDHALDQLWTSHSVRPEVTFGSERFSVKLVSDLLPKLASKGAVKWMVGSGHS